MFRTHPSAWSHLAPSNSCETTEVVERLFHCVAVLMTRQLRSLVEDSIHDFVGFLSMYETGNDFGMDGSDYHKLKYTLPQVP